MPGVIGGERFAIKECLGAGAFGVVYRAHDRAQHLDVALKTMKDADPALLARFKQEFRALAGIVHPNLVTLYHLFVEDEWFFTMELVEGEHYLEHVRPAGALRVDRLRATLPQLVAGVHALHRAGKLHRDLKSSNVLVRRDGRIMVCDFGLVTDVARPVRDQAGTPMAMAPEQIAGAALSEASDWYAVGVLLYEALTGHPPFEGHLMEVLIAKQAAPPRPPRALDPRAPIDLDALCMALLQIAPTARPGGEELLARLGAAPTPRGAPAAFIGRRRELDALDDALAASRDRCVAVLIHGRSGIGKSALCRRFLDHAARGGALVLEGRCYDHESVPYKALDALVDALAEHLAKRPVAAAAGLVTDGVLALARLFPVLATVPAVEARGEPLLAPRDPVEVRAAASGGLRGLLAALAAEQPTVLFIDDIHWGDADSAGFLVDLIHHPDAPALLLLGSYRAEEEASSPLVQALLEPPARAMGDLRRLPLDPLSAADGRELAIAILGSGDYAGARTDAIVADAAGDPFLISVLADESARGAAAAPAGMDLDHVLRRRVERLPAPARALLAAAATAGLPTPLDLLGEVAEVADLPATLAILLAEHLVRTRTAAAIEEVEPYHDRIRQVVVAGMAATEVRRVHQRLADVFTREQRDDPFALFEHCLRAGDRARAALHAAAAADRAEATFAYAQAARYHERVLELAGLDGDPRRRVLARRADALAHAGQLADAAHSYLAAADGADATAALELRRHAVEHLLRSGRLEEGLDLLVQLLAEVGLRLPRSRRGALAQLVVARARLALRGLRFRPRPAERIDPAALRRIDVGAAAAAGLSFIDPLIGSVLQARELLTALDAGEVGRAAYALNLEVGFRAVAGVPGRAGAERIVASTRVLAEQTGDPGQVGWCIGASALIPFCCGEFELALERITEAEPLIRQNLARFHWQVDLLPIYRTASLLYLGRLREVSRLVPLLLREALRQGNVYLANALRGFRTNMVWLLLGEPATARDQLAEAAPRRTLTTRFHLHHYFQLLNETQLDLYEGDGDGAWRRLERTWRELERSMLLRFQFSCVEGFYLRARAALAAAAAAPDGATCAARLRDAERCARRIEHEAVPWGNALAALARAGVAARRGDQARAASLYEQASAACAAVHMRHYAAAAGWRCGELRGASVGGALVRDASQWFTAQGVADPGRLVGLLAPG